MASSYSRIDGYPLPDWSKVAADDRESLMEEVPDRLKRVMYPGAADTDAVPDSDFARHAAEADKRLAALIAREPKARQYFGSWTFAKVTKEPDPRRAAEAEYYLCDALIEYGNQYYGWVWSKDFPVLAHTVHLYRN
ncbi:hypothetical protein [Streptomyces sp. NPDC088258]|uniref:hypothetical protein n=1 Tax=Streptomyces sp. NPDC088258 TaxID=3365849 RepID=UPI003817AB0D